MSRVKKWTQRLQDEVWHSDDSEKSVPLRCLDKAGKKRSGQRERPGVSPLYLGSKGKLPKEAGLTTAVAPVPRACPGGAPQGRRP